MKTVLASSLTLVNKIAQLEVMKYLFELVIVFLGVYLAFLLTDFQDAVQERDIRVQHYESLALELQVLASTLEFEEAKLRKHMRVVEEIDQGKRPQIPPSDLLYIYTGSVRDAAFNSRHFEALDSDIVQNIIHGSFGLSMLEKQVESFNDKSNALLPVLATNEDCCYDEDGQLLEHWQWYPQLITDIYNLNQAAREGITNQAIPDLQESIRQMQNLPPRESKDSETN